MTRSFLVLHEARVRRQSILSCTGCAACLGQPNGGRRARGETAALRWRCCAERSPSPLGALPGSAASSGPASTIPQRRSGTARRHAAQRLRALTPGRSTSSKLAARVGGHACHRYGDGRSSRARNCLRPRGLSAAEAPVVEAPLPDSRPTPPSETRGRLVSLFRPDRRRRSTRSRPRARSKLSTNAWWSKSASTSTSGRCTNGRPKSTRTR